MTVGDLIDILNMYDNRIEIVKGINGDIDTIQEKDIELIEVDDHPYYPEFAVVIQ